MPEKNPTISVLMPVYNAAPYLKEAIESILNQTYTDFEFLIFNDGSTDESADIIRRYDDQRIVFHDSLVNLGYVTHLNKGLQEARGQYIARMDADDIAMPERFTKQIAVLEKDTHMGICGSWMKIIHTEEVIRYPHSHQEITDRLLIENPFAHSAVMFRTDIVRIHRLQYKQDYMPTEDFKLWSEILNFSNGHNVPEVLLHYRRHSGQISSVKNQLQLWNLQRVKTECLSYGYKDLSIREKQLFESIDAADLLQLDTSLQEWDELLFKLRDLNAQFQRFSVPSFEARLIYLWKINVSTKTSLQGNNLLKSRFFCTLPWKDKVKFLLRMARKKRK